MSDADPVRGLIVAHANVADALVRAVEEISGVRGALLPMSNAECSPDELESRLEESLRGGPTVLFVDFSSGSCGYVGRKVGRRAGQVAVVTGVNLPMLLDFVFHRRMELQELAERVVEKGRAEASVELYSEPAAGGDPPV